MVNLGNCVVGQPSIDKVFTMEHDTRWYNFPFYIWLSVNIIDEGYCVHVLQQSLYNLSCHIHVFEHICSLPQPYKYKIRFDEPIGD